VARTLTVEQLALEAGSSVDVVHRLVQIGVLNPGSLDRFLPGDIIRVEAVQAFIDSGLRLDQIASAIEQGLFTFEFLDALYSQRAPSSGHTYEEFKRSIGRIALRLPAIYAAMGLPEPEAAAVLRTDEEEILTEFLAVWGESSDEEALTRAARLVGEPARMVSYGWVELYYESTVGGHDRTDLHLADHIEAIARTGPRTTALLPKMLLWLQQRHMQSAIDHANFEAIEQRLARQGLAPPRPDRPAAMAFADISGYTHMTLQSGDRLAVRFSERLREAALEVARQYRGKLVRLLGDGAMLHFRDPEDGVRGTTDLVRMFANADFSLHAGVHAGPMIERDGDYFGQTVNLASRVSSTAGAGEIKVTRAVVAATEGSGVRYEAAGPAVLKGLDEPIELFRVMA
jgi:adenylate cyclase